MAIEAIDAVMDAENKARTAKAEAAALSKKLVAEAEERGADAIENAKKKAAEEIADLMRKAGDKAKNEALELARSTENRKAAMSVRAAGRTNKAVSFVIERIVNG